ncbi:unnamed protein product, partial [Meganyctiphanes norvegica]
MVNCVSDISIEITQEIKIIKITNTVETEITRTVDISILLSEINNQLDTLATFIQDTSTDVAEGIFDTILSFSTSLIIEKDIAVTSSAIQLLKNSISELDNMIGILTGGGSITITGLSVTRTSVTQSIKTIETVILSLESSKDLNEEVFITRQVNGALTSSTALLKKVTTSSTAVVYTSVALSEGLTTLQDLQFSKTAITQQQLIKINQIEIEIAKAIELGQTIENINIFTSTVTSIYTTIKTIVQESTTEISSTSTVQSTLKSNFLLTELKDVIGQIISKVGNDITSVAPPSQTANNINSALQILNRISTTSTITNVETNELDAVLNGCRNMLGAAQEGVGITGIETVLITTSTAITSISSIVTVAIEKREIFESSKEVSIKVELMEQIITTITSLEGSTIVEGSVEQQTLINRISILLSRITTLTNADIFQLKQLVAEFSFFNTAVTGLDLVLIKANSAFTIINENKNIIAEEKKILLQLENLKSTLTLIDSSLSIVQNLETSENLEIDVNNVFITTLLNIIKIISSGGFTTKDIIKLESTISSIGSLTIVTGLKGVRTIITEAKEVIVLTLKQIEEVKEETKALSIQSTILNLIQTSETLMQNFASTLTEFTETDVSIELVDLVQIIQIISRGTTEITASVIETFKLALENFKAFTQNVQTVGVEGIETYIEDVKNIKIYLQMSIQVNSQTETQFELITKSETLIYFIVESLGSLVSTGTTSVSKSYSIIVDIIALFTSMSMENFIFTKEVIELLIEYKSAIIQLKSQSTSFVEILGIETALSLSTSVIETIGNIKEVEGNNFKTVTTLTNAKQGLIMVDNVLSLLKKVTYFTTTDNSISFTTLSNFVLSISNDITIIYNQETAAILKTIQTEIYTIIDQNLKPSNIDNIFSLLVNVRQEINIYVTQLQLEYTSLITGQTTLKVKTQFQTIYSELKFLIGGIDSSQLTGEVNAEFITFIEIIKKMLLDINSVTIEDIALITTEWTKVKSIIETSTSVNVALGGLLDIEILIDSTLQEIQAKVDIQIQTQTLTKYIVLLDQNRLILQNILFITNQGLSSSTLKIIENVQLKQIVTELMIVFQSISFEISTSELIRIKEIISSIDISNGIVTEFFQLKTLISQSIISFTKEITLKQTFIVGNIVITNLNQGIIVLENIKVNLLSMLTITSEGEGGAIELPIIKDIFIFLERISISNIQIEDINALKFLLKDLTFALGTLQKDFKITGLTDMIILIETTIISMKTVIGENNQFIIDASKIQIQNKISVIINNIYVIVSSLLEKTTSIGITVEMDKELLSQIIIIINLINTDVELNQEQINFIVSFEDKLKSITITTEILQLLTQLHSVIEISKTRILEKKLLNEIRADRKIEIDNMNIFQHLLLMTKAKINLVLKDIGYIFSSEDGVEDKNMNIFFVFLKSVSTVSITTQLLEDFRVNFKLIENIQGQKGFPIIGLNNLNSIIVQKQFEIKETIAVISKVILFDKHITTNKEM